MKRTACVIVALLGATACGGRQQPVVRSLELQKSYALPTVRPAEPAFSVSFDKQVSMNVLNRVRKPGVLGVPIRVDRLRVASLARSLDLRVAAVKPLAFRPLAPAPTREAEFVWRSLLQGEIIVTPAAAEKLRLTTDNQLVIGNKTFPIGAFADPAIPNFADVLLPEFRARELHLKKSRLLMVGVRRKTKADELRTRLRRIAPNARIRALSPAAASGTPPAPQPLGTAEGPLIGAMTYRIRKDGFIEPDPAWVQSNIATGEVPLLGSVMCHRLLIPQLGAALAEIDRKGLDRHIDADRYGGCYVPRFIGRDPRRGLSLHAFGLALDLNVSTNHYGTRGDMDTRIVAIFNKWGFAWGGTWSTPDPMHFELARLIQP